MAAAYNYDDEDKRERNDTLLKLSSKLKRLYEFIGSSKQNKEQSEEGNFFKEFSVHLSNVLDVIGPSDNVSGDSKQGLKANFFHRIAEHLNKVLDTIEASENIRAKYRKRAMMHEILYSTKYAIVDQGLASTYIFGSNSEGTTTQGLQSDVDILHCYDDIPVVEHPDDAPENKLALLMVLDDTKPGYVKLQKVLNKVPQTVYHGEIQHGEEADYRGRICWKQVILIIKSSTIRHGPAFTIPGTEMNMEQDNVWSVRCKTIPSFAKEWLHRVRPFQWPSKQMLQKMGTYGCFFVCVGHPRSCTKDREWRISFSLQERELMSSLNITQYKCYILLKIIKKEIIQQRVGKSLSSYHCKTCLFYLVENSDMALWSPKNLLYSIHACFRILLHWVEEENCPNYFIREENMFDRLEKETLKQIGSTLKSLLSGGVNFLSTLSCDNLGWFLTDSLAGGNLDILGIKVKEHLTFYFYANMTGLLFGFRKRIYDEYIYGTHLFDCLMRASHVLYFMEHTKTITEHKPSDVDIAFKHFLPQMHLTIARILGSIALADRKENSFAETQNAFEEQIENSKDCDLMSSRLIAATLYLKVDRLDKCLDILKNCEEDLEPHIISTCHCHEFNKYRNFLLENVLVAENVSFYEFQKKYVAACINFHPIEHNLIHPALQFEMYSSLFTSCEKENREYDYIEIDSKVYVYFLQYICFSKTDDIVTKDKALFKLRNVINEPFENLGHRGTANNILGWVYLQEHNHKEAFKCFYQSLKYRPSNNAAKWHMLILIHCMLIEQVIYERKWFT